MTPAERCDEVVRLIEEALADLGAFGAPTSAPSSQVPPVSSSRRPVSPHGQTRVPFFDESSVVSLGLGKVVKGS